MQYLKDEVKQAIIESAINEFKNKSYIKASMRSIAENAGITVGNIYRYFKNKDDLINEILDPVWDELKKIIFDQYNMTKGFPIEEIITAIMDIYMKYDQELFILLNKSAGSKYENVKYDLINLIEKRVEEDIMESPEMKGKIIEDPFVFYIISNAIVESIYMIMKECGNDLKRFQTLMEKTIIILYKDLEKRI